MRTDEDPRAGPKAAVTAAHLFLLWGLAVAQPLYAVLGRYAEVFVARHAPAWQVWALAGIASVLLPGLLVAVVLLLRRLHRALDLEPPFVAALAAVVVLPIAKKALAATAPLLAVAAAAGIVAAIAQRRSGVFRLFLTAFSPAALVFPAFFLLASPASRIALPSRPAPTGAARGVETPVVVVVFDAFSTSALLDEEGEVDATLFPHFARLAGRSTWYRQSQAVAEATIAALPALLTGTDPDRSKLPFAEDYPRNLFTWLGASGETHVLEAATWLCPPEVCAGGPPPSFRGLLADAGVVLLHVLAPPAWTARLPSLDQRWTGFAGAAAARASEARGATEVERLRWRQAIVAQFVDRHETREERLGLLERFLATLPAQAGPSLSFLHLDLPHSPFVFLPSGRRYVREGEEQAELFRALLGVFDRGEMGRDLPQLVDLAYRRSFLQHLFADRLLGRILDRLDERGLLAPSLLVVTADHGETYVPGHPRRDLADGDTLQVPLFVKTPGQATGAIDDRAADSRDLVPTIADLLALEVPWAVDGRSLAGPADTPAAWTPELTAAWKRKLERVGSGDLRRVYALGPASELVGRPLDAAVEQGRALLEPTDPGTRAGLLHGAELASIDPASDFRPGYLLGQALVAPGRTPPKALALAVDGRVWATTWSFPVGPASARFAFLVPEEALAPGPHAWQLYALEPADAGRPPRLVPLAGLAPPPSGSAPGAG